MLTHYCIANGTVVRGVEDIPYGNLHVVTSAKFDTLRKEIM